MTETDADSPFPDTARLLAVTLDEASLGRDSVEVEHEREVAIFDLLEKNNFLLEGDGQDGPYTLHLSLADNRLVFAISDEDGNALQQIMLSLSPFRRIVKDYFLICDSYYAAIKTQPASKIEAIDMGRRGLHDEGSQLLMERLKGKVTVDIATARRLFTLLCALHWKG
ncbi:hypothetical protein AUC70_00150 [Methyloceanibacter stevinii]|uniref:UPF0262 protein AUC70_00150 n=1 Tax=Methyloceanibacter stevinii TaxID=1774970 RepID=A0A1E3VW26_9HYPH|nr:MULTISPECIES: UPF0262 family protein [Methyloceanibacter]ODR97481.1 hypothetical protein AUC70_00150 [Methyloceanibacter stevinii]